MRGDYFDDFMPWSINSENLSLKNRYDMDNLGKENLLFVARFWEQHARKMYDKANTATTYEEREKFKYDASRSSFKAREIRKIAKTAQSKPCIFEKPSFKTGDSVVCFLEQPSRFCFGIIAKINITNPVFDEADEVIAVENAVFLIRINDQSERRLITYVPDALTLFTSKDFEYFRSHWHYFKTYLNYYAQTISEHDKVNRMLSCLSGQPDPPTVA